MDPAACYFKITAFFCKLMVDLISIRDHSSGECLQEFPRMVRMTGRLPVKEDDGMSPAQRPVSTHHTTHSGVRPHKECAAEKVREHSGVLSEVPGVPSAIHLWGSRTARPIPAAGAVRTTASLNGQAQSPATGGVIRGMCCSCRR